MVKTEGDVTIYYCDRCGSEFAKEKKDEKPNPDDTRVSRGTYFLFPVIDADGDVEFEPKHLCGPCTVSLYNWLNRA